MQEYLLREGQFYKVKGEIRLGEDGKNKLNFTSFYIQKHRYANVISAMIGEPYYDVRINFVDDESKSLYEILTQMFKEGMVYIRITGTDVNITYKKAYITELCSMRDHGDILHMLELNILEKIILNESKSWSSLW